MICGPGETWKELFARMSQQAWPDPNGTQFLDTVIDLDPEPRPIQQIFWNGRAVREMTPPQLIRALEWVFRYGHRPRKDSNHF